MTEAVALHQEESVHLPSETLQKGERRASTRGWEAHFHFAGFQIFSHKKVSLLEERIPSVLGLAREACDTFPGARHWTSHVAELKDLEERLTADRALPFSSPFFFLCKEGETRGKMAKLRKLESALVI